MDRIVAGTRGTLGHVLLIRATGRTRSAATRSASSAQTRAQRANNERQQEQQRANNERQQRGNNDRAPRDNNWRGQVNGHADQGWNRRNDNRGSNAVRGYVAPRSRVDVVRPRFNHHYGPSYSVFFGIGSGYRYGAPFHGRVYGYVPAPVYGARIYYGDVRLEVRPREAAVFVDGYYAGIVDDFDGVFQRLTLTVGPHEIEIEAPGLEPQVFNVLVDPSRTIDVRADLYPLP